MNSSIKHDRIDETLRALDSQKHLNYVVITREYDVHLTTFMRRYCEKSVSQQVSTLEQQQLFNNIQEDELLRYIDNLTNRFISLIIQIIRNLTEEILKRSVRKN